MKTVNENTKDRYIWAILSWPLTMLLFLIVDAIIRRLDPKFYEPRSDYTGEVTKGLIDLFGPSGSLWWGLALIAFPIIFVTPMTVIVWKQNRFAAVALSLAFFVLTIVIFPFIYLIYSCSTGVACI